MDQTSAGSQRTTGPLALVIGVTGHRDLRPEDVPRLEEIVRSIFTDLRARYPHTPLEILSPLAEGADRLVARVALDLGARLVVPLPMPRELYLDDFESEESRAEFDHMLARADEVVELPLYGEATLEDIREHGPARDMQYGVMGAWTVRNSHALIALWDGVISHLPHGTADIVRFNLEGIPDSFAPSRGALAPVEGDPVYHIVTRRRNGNADPGDSEPTLQMLYPPGFGPTETGEKYLSVLQHTERFNRDVVEQERKDDSVFDQSRSWVIGDDIPRVRELGLDSTLELFARADTLASRFGRHTRRSLKGIFVAVLLAVIVFDIYTHVYLLAWPLLAGYLLFLVVTYALVLRSSRQEYHSRYLDYRALAEGLRVRLFWDIAGVGDEVADNYLHKQRSELDWIRYALRVWRPGEGKNMASLVGGRNVRREDAVDERERLDITCRRWIKDQLQYYVRSAHYEERAAHRATLWANVFIIVGILLALGQVVMQGVDNPDFTKQPNHWLLVAVALSPIFAGLFVGYAEKRAHHDHARQYERMALLFAQAKERMEELMSKNRFDRGVELIEELGKEALAENGDWVLVHRDRPIEAPKG